MFDDDLLQHTVGLRIERGWVYSILNPESWTLRYCICCPPLMAMFAPVTKAASSEHK